MHENTDAALPSKYITTSKNTNTQLSSTTHHDSRTWTKSNTLTQSSQKTRSTPPYNAYYASTLPAHTPPAEHLDADACTNST